MRNTHFILDEAGSSIGHLDCLDTALDKGRAFSIRLQWYFQGVPQVKKCFPDGQEENLLQNVVQIFMATNSLETANYISNRVGHATIVAESGGSSRGTSVSLPSYGTGQGSSSSSSNQNDNWSQLGRKLALPEEILAWPLRRAVTFVPGMPPILTRPIRYYEEDVTRLSEADKVGFKALMRSAALAVFALVMAAGSFGMVAEEMEQRRQASERVRMNADYWAIPSQVRQAPEGQ